MKTASEFRDGTLALRFIGELDHHAARGAVRELERAVDRYLPVSCIVDMSALTFMDSSGIAVLLKARRRMLELGGVLRVTGLAGQPGRVISAAGLERMIDFDTVSA